MGVLKDICRLTAVTAVLCAAITMCTAPSGGGTYVFPGADTTSTPKPPKDTTSTPDPDTTSTAFVPEPQDAWPSDPAAPSDPGFDKSEAASFVWQPKSGHPKLFISDNTFPKIKTKLASVSTTDPFYRYHSWIMDRAEQSIQDEALEYFSTTGSFRPKLFWPAEQRISSCAYAYLYSGDKRYLEAAYRDASALCAFPDWNAKQSGLDFTEAAYAVALAYDWLYGALTEEQRKTLREGIYNLAFTPHLNAFSESGTYKSGVVSQNYLTAQNNWNAVCTGGLTVACLALSDDYPAETQRIAAQCVKANVSMSKTIYGSDGTYPEGYGYWGFGTNLEVSMAAALETANRSDYLWDNLPGFRETWRYSNNVESLGVGTAFNYMDSSGGVTASVPNWYFARKLNDPSIIWPELYKLQRYGESTTSQKIYNKKTPTSQEAHRFFPIFFAMAVDLDLSKAQRPADNVYLGWGNTPVMMVHNGWTYEDAGAFLGIKGGSGAKVTHSHIDAGSFLYDARNVRWAYDYGTASYTRMQNVCREFTGSDLGFWSYNTTSVFRWTINVLNNTTHNTIMVADELNNPTGFASFTNVMTSGNELGGTLDMTPVFSGSYINSAKRRVTLEGMNLKVMDYVRAKSGKTEQIEWRMLTKTRPEITKDGILLTGYNGCKALLKTKLIDESVEYRIFPYSHRPFVNGGVSHENTWDVDLASESYYIVGFTAAVSGEMIFTTTITQL